MKKVISLILSLVMIAALFTGCGASKTTETTPQTAAPAAEAPAETAAPGSYTVAIVQQMDHASLDEIRNAITAELQAAAAEKGIAIEIEEFNGQNDATVLNQIGAQLVGDKVDMIIPFQTLHFNL